MRSLILRLCCVQTDQRRVFKKYVQFNASTTQAGNGSGLGLYSTFLPVVFCLVASINDPIRIVSAGIIEQMGGVIGLQSLGLGQGCLFYFEIDATLSLDDFEAPKEELDMQVELSVSSISRYCEVVRPEIAPETKDSNENLSRALVVDDSTLNRKLLKNLIADFFEEIVQV
jgi:hypothetical protein